MMVFAATGLAGLAVGTVAAPASAAGVLVVTPPPPGTVVLDHELQICALSSYPAVAHVNPVDLGGGASTPDVTIGPVSPGKCQTETVETDNQSAQVDVYEVQPDSELFYIGSNLYNGDASGPGIGAQGSATAPTFETWG